MDEFRIQPTPGDNPYRDTAGSKSKKRRKDEHGEEGAPNPEDVVTLSGEQGDGATAADFYTPYVPPEEKD